MLGEIPAHGLLLLGDLPGPAHDELHDSLLGLARACGWPVVAEPTANVHASEHFLHHGVLVLGADGFLQRHPPEIVVSAGLFGLSRPTLDLLRRARRHVALDLAGVGREVCDPLRTATTVLGGVPRPTREPRPDPAWLRAWQEADRIASDVVTGLVGAFAGGAPPAGGAAPAGAAPAGAAPADVPAPERNGGAPVPGGGAARGGALAPSGAPSEALTGVGVAAAVLGAAGDDGLILIGASWPARQAEIVSTGSPGVRLIGNRGANGIDGLVGTAWGAALAHQGSGGGRALALIGDLAFLHDHNGLLAGAGQPEPDLTVVVVDNDGGGIFHQLEQGRAEFADAFEDVFATPVGRDLVAVALAAGRPAVRVRTPEHLRRELAAAQQGGGVRVVVADVRDRYREASLLDRIRKDVVRRIDGQAYPSAHRCSDG
jgi:2-succinyl-5-enolpyruvyl-6-hydroxy-3-cyclohexene-1-carboxylate synthase